MASRGSDCVTRKQQFATRDAAREAARSLRRHRQAPTAQAFRCGWCGAGTSATRVATPLKAGGADDASCAHSTRDHPQAGAHSRLKPAAAVWSLRSDSNRRPAHYECAALPTELPRQPRNRTPVDVSHGPTTVRQCRSAPIEDSRCPGNSSQVSRGRP
jgi:hypothetical protein